MRGLTLLRILLTLEVAGRLEELAGWFQRRGERALACATKRWPDFPDYAYARIGIITPSRRPPHDEA